ncbi:MAG: hypothetical protein AAB564_02260 [Patescibacteria group bacterium]
MRLKIIWNVVLLLLIIFLIIIAGCASRFPTEKEWLKVPVAQKENIEFVLQGDFKAINEFLRAADQLKEGMSLDEVKKLGFSTEAKNSCDKIGWLETSDIILANTHLAIDFQNIENMTAGKKQYEGIKCRAADSKIRTDRLFTYFNSRDTYRVGCDIKLVLIFKNKILVGININNQLIRQHESERAFGKVIGDIFSPPEIKLNSPIK